MRTHTLPAAHAPFHVGETARRVIGALAHGIAVASGAQARFDRVRRLQGLSDAELDRLGLRRDDIVRHVYAEVFSD